MGHTYSNLLIHVIFSTKNRTASITPELRPRLYGYMGGVARNEFGRGLEIGGTADHLHGLMSLNRDVFIADAVRDWKSLTSGWVHRTFPSHKSFAWQPGYGAFSVSQSNTDAVRHTSHARKNTIDT